MRIGKIRVGLEHVQAEKRYDGGRKMVGLVLPLMQSLAHLLILLFEGNDSAFVSRLLEDGLVIPDESNLII